MDTPQLTDPDAKALIAKICDIDLSPYDMDSYLAGVELGRDIGSVIEKTDSEQLFALVVLISDLIGGLDDA